MTPLYDTHCHLDAPEFDDDREVVWSRARAVGVTCALIPAVEPSSWPKTLACALPGERVAALGVHPQYLPRLTESAIDDAMASLEATIRRAGDAVVAVGECGFDAWRDDTRGQTTLQRRVFAAHAAVARALELPLVVHVLKAHGEALAAMRSVSLPRRPGVIHSYSGSAELVTEYVSLGWHLAVGGSVTRPGARRPVEALRRIPADRLLLETDAPDQVPSGVVAGVRRCEPSHLSIIATRAAALRGEDVDVMAARCTATARGLFRRG